MYILNNPIDAGMGVKVFVDSKGIDSLLLSVGGWWTVVVSKS